MYRLNRAMCEGIIAEARARCATNTTCSYEERVGLVFEAQCVQEYMGVLRGYVKVAAFEQGDWVTVAKVWILRLSGLDRLEELSNGKIKFE